MSLNDAKHTTLQTNLNQLYPYASKNVNMFRVIQNFFHYNFVAYTLLTKCNSLVLCFPNFSFVWHSYSLVSNRLTPLFAPLNTSFSASVKKSTLKAVTTILQVRRLKPLTDVRPEFNSYHTHPFFFLYRQNFFNSWIPVSSPYVKKKQRMFPLISRLFARKSIKTLNLSKKIFNYRKVWFLSILSKLKHKIKIINTFHDQTFRRLLKTSRIMQDSPKKKKNYLFPKQHLFLNGTKFSTKNKYSSKTSLLNRITHFYKYKLRRLTLNDYNSSVTVKNLKYKLHLLSLHKREEKFSIKSLNDPKFWSSKLYLNRIIRRGKSKSKLQRTKHYYFSLNRLIQCTISSKSYFSLTFYYSNSKTRYLNRFFRTHIRRYYLNSSKKICKPLLNNSLNKSISLPYLGSSITSPVSEYNGIRYFINDISWSSGIKWLIGNFNNTFNRFLSTGSPFLNHVNLKISESSLTPDNLLIFSKYKSSFIFSTVGFLFTQNIISSISTSTKISLNKFRYSFFSKKDLKKSLLKKPGKLKLITSSLVSTNYRNRNTVLNDTLTHFNWLNGFYDNTHLTDTLKRNLSTTQNNLFHYKYSQKHDHFLGSFLKKEVRMKRIKFKPGYLRIWRNAREAINYTLNLNVRYQYRLTRHLYRLQHLTKQTQALIFDLTLKNVLLNSHFAYDHHSSLLLISNGLVFVNGIMTNNPNMHLFQNDFIQIVVSLKYYIIYRWFLNWQATKRIRMRKLAKTKFKKTKMMANKQRSQNLPDWLLTSRSKSFDIPKYLEVDFFSLSSYILYEPFTFTDFNSLHFLDVRPEILNMYSWKYIN